jgi:hypothetical protein
MSEFQVRKDKFATHRLIEESAVVNQPTINEGEILVKVDRFAFTANNITYAVLGESLNYWQFFPSSGADADGWGVIPVWGFAVVVDSKAPEVPVGERLFGYFPPATFLTMMPARVTPQRLFDNAAHRSKLPPGYNSYSRVLAETGYDNKMDNARMLLWPLHMTSFCLWDLLKEKNWFGAAQIVILSASSKTSIGLAYAMAADTAAPKTIACTSARNIAFVDKLGLYSQIVSYDALNKIDPNLPTLLVDMSGDSQVLERLHNHLGEQIKRCVSVGLTHWDETQGGSSALADRSEFFFAPAQIQKRMKDWGVDGFAARTSTFLRDTALQSMSWLKITELKGLSGLAAVYPDVCTGHVAPDQGLIVTM